MNFVRKRKRGVNQRDQKVWFSEGHHYRITWVRKVFGVEVTPHYHVCVYAMRPDGKKYWDFAGRRGPYKKLSTAIEAAEKHEKVWRNALSIIVGDRKGRNDRLRNLDWKSRPGEKPTKGRLLGSVPVWVKKESPDLLRAIMNVLHPKGRSCDSDPTETSLTSVESTPSQDSPESIPVSGVAEPNERITSTAIAGDEPHATTVKAPVKARKKSASRNTTRKSPAGKPKSKRRSSGKAA